MTRTRKLPKDQQRMVSAARRAGWRVQDSSDGVKCFPPDGVSPPLTVHSSPKRNGHSQKNMLQDFKRHGVML